MAVAPSQDVNTLEDLHRFPSESLHSFSFAQRSEELLHSRQNILKRSIDFMRDRFRWGSSNTTGIVNPQARTMRGDTDPQGMADLLSQSHISGASFGPMTGPADVGADNVFEKTFAEVPRHIPEVKDAVQPPAQPPTQQQLTSSQQLPPPELRGLKSAPTSRRVSLKRTFTDASSSNPQRQLIDTLAQPYTAGDSFSPLSSSTIGSVFPSPALHTHSSKWNPVSQAVFRTESKAPWTILAANDLSCLVFGVTQAEVRKLSILEVVQEDRRQWLESKLQDPTTDAAAKVRPSQDKSRMKPAVPRSMGMGNGVTAQLLSKPPSRAGRPSRRAQTDDGYGSSAYSARQLNHPATKSRGVLLCGDVVPIQKRNGAKGSASIWVMEKKGGLIWVLEEIQEDVAYISCDESWNVTAARGATDKVWGHGVVETGQHLTKLLPHIPQSCLESSVEKGLSDVAEMKYFAAATSGAICIPTTVSREEGSRSLRVSSYPHVAGIMVLSSSSLKIISSNSVFSSVLFGYERPEGLDITDLIPGFDDFLYVISDEENVPLVDGVVIPELSFRRARTLSMLREGKANVASVFLEPSGITAKHRDGSTIAVDVQLRVAKSGSIFPKPREKKTDDENDAEDSPEDAVTVTELVYALWVTYSRNIHSHGPPAQPPSPQHEEEESLATSSSETLTSKPSSKTSAPQLTLPEGQDSRPTSTLSQQLSEAASESLTDKPVQPVPELNTSAKRTIADYVILEEMGQGAYGEVKLARLKKNPTKKVVLKYVTKKRILVDTWTRDRRLGTVPLEIHVLDYLRRDGFKHPNIVAMEGFFEDDVNYYIEMLPHGLPGMDLFDYIEIKQNMDEQEARNIFKQVVSAIHHLHTKALVVHRDIKDENVILDGEGRIKLIDFGSAAYIKNGPFDVFVGTIDYAAPEVLQGKSYRGKEQDIWALGILLYTIVYKENPFYNIDEILDHPLRVPFIPFQNEDCIDLIRRMLDRDVDNRLTIGEIMEHPWMVDC
ncbi:hypothetical protein BDV18DRAFT_157847 [Aspergillus unguis]